MLGRILAICLGLMTACYSPPKPDCGFSCGTGGACPDDYFCAQDNFCHLNGTPTTTVCAVDARPDTPKPIDATPADGDLSPPQVLQTQPANNATGVATSTTINVEFTEPVLNVNTTTFIVASNMINIAGTVMSPGDPYNFYFTPTALLPASAQIDVQLTNGIYDGNANQLLPYSFKFTTGP